jgi:TolB-like protein/DNA-binding winged helix-turn-helix (wHTH) protein/tetratricopeptide (TPR) repeat protein
MSFDATAMRGYRFGVFEVDLAEAAVRREGLQVRLRGKPFDILVALLERPGDLVSRDELRQRLWASDTFVDFDHGLNAAMNRLRDALGDAADNPRFIQTIPRRGYRFIAPVQSVVATPPATAAPEAAAVAAVVSSPQPRRPSTGRWYVVGGALALVLATAAAAWYARSAVPSSSAGSQRKMIAVLPFENLSGDAEQDYFSQGITDELISQLGALNPERLGVIARTTVLRYRAGEQSVSEIGKALGVQYVLEGTVRRSGEHVRITAQLVDVSSQTQLWSETYDHEVKDVLLTQRDVAVRVADALTMSVLSARPVPQMPSSAAYEAYLRGRYLRQEATQVSLARALTQYERAIQQNPSYAGAYAGIADVYHVLGGPGWEFGPPRELLPKARDAAQRAIELDPDLPDGYAVRGMTRLWLDWNPETAEQDLRRAIALNPSLAQAHQYLSTVLVVQRRNDDAIAAARRAAELDPLSPISMTTVAYRYYYAERYQEAIEEFEGALRLVPEFASARVGEAQAHLALGHTKEALTALERALPVAGGRTFVRAHLAYAQGVAGLAEEARRTQARLVAEAGSDYVSPFHLALIAAGLGDRAVLRAQLERAFTDRSGWMMFVPFEREFAPYRAELTDLVARVRQR